MRGRGLHKRVLHDRRASGCNEVGRKQRVCGNRCGRGYCGDNSPQPFLRYKDKQDNRAYRQLREPESRRSEPRGNTGGQHRSFQLPGIWSYSAAYGKYHQGSFPADGGLFLRNKAFYAHFRNFRYQGSCGYEHHRQGRKVS